MSDNLGFKVGLGIAGFITIIGFIMGIMYFVRIFNAATLHTQVINPRPDIECVVVSAQDSTSVDCWRKTEINHSSN